MSAHDLEMLSEIHKSLTDIKQSLTADMHKISLDVAEVKIELSSLKSNFASRLDKLENELAAHNNHIQIVKDDIHILDKKLSELKTAPDDIAKTRHRINNIDQRVVIIEQQMKEIEGIKQTANENKTLLGNQGAIISFVTSKPVGAIILFIAGVIASKYGFNGNV